MELWLVDINQELVEAWRNEFRGFDEVNLVCGNILRIAENTIVSPANSYGYMDGGIDLEYTYHFGLQPQQRSDSGPGDFIAVYRSGQIAFGESTFEDSVWALTHRWLREPGIATIRLRFLDDHTYEQEVVDVASDGTPTPHSLALMKRERATP